MEPITTFSGTCVALPIENIDTDQIIPARFLKATDKQGMGDNLFADWRYAANGQPNPDFPLNRPEAKGAQILVGGHNFGCGSSREHAPWALQGFGFRAVISTYFADIFRNNALKVGLLPIVVDPETHYQLVSMVEEDPTTPVTIDLEAQQVRLPDGQAISFPIDPFAKYCLVNGVDQLGFLQSQEAEIAAFEQQYGARINTGARG
ncbi:MAG: 3-isopropylmalate dehydratase small subunit [Chloroflexi bacterium]|nr:MAG: 3-isopropylmalate dehydratase small subunit [Chloroflexota bacterium]